MAAGFILIRQPWFQAQLFQVFQHRQATQPPADPPATHSPAYGGPRLDATALRSSGDLFRPTNIWEAHLRFTAPQWTALGPRRIPPLPNWLGADGTPVLRNPHASRAGIAGTLGWDLPWSTATAEFGGVTFTNVAIRFKGNGTFLEAMQGYKKSFKLDLNEGAPGRALAGQKTLNLHNLTADRSFLADTLGYEFYREAGVPACRTTFARVFLTIEGRWEHRLLGLYALIENPDSRWARTALGTDKAALFKPVAVRLFEDLGANWEPYEDVYAPRDDPAPEVRQRLIDLCRLVSRADDAEFARRIGEVLDLDAAARFLACEALLSNYDGILMNGQNFILWLDPRSQRFGFSPWDLDHSWGEFGMIGSVTDRERASLFHPWVGSVRLLERLYGLPEFTTRYRRELTRLLDTLFLPDRLNRRIDELAAVIRPAVAEQPDHRLAGFESALADAVRPAGQSAPESGDPGGFHLKHFIRVRAAEARAQLEGRSEGIRLRRGGPW